MSEPLAFEEAFRVIKVDEQNYVGAHPLRLPMAGARGVYGGHTCAQTLLVAIESAPGFVPYAFHSYFIGAGSASRPMEYHVTEISDEENYTHRSIKVTQKGRAKYTALVSLVREGVKFDSKRNEVDIQIPRTKIMKAYNNNTGKLTVVEHTDYVRNAYSPEFKNFRLVPEEENQAAAERWVTVWGGINNHNRFKDNKKITFLNPIFNYVGLADLSDSAILTTLARILHLDWNPTKDNPFEDFDHQRDARNLLRSSMNILHLFHYNAMSLDHHIYFHLDNFEESFNICKDWVGLSYQAKRNSNNRSLIRGCMFNKNGQCVATIVQEGLTYFFDGVPDNAKL